MLQIGLKILDMESIPEQLSQPRNGVNLDCLLKTHEKEDIKDLFLFLKIHIYNMQSNNVLCFSIILNHRYLIRLFVYSFSVI